MQRISRTIRVLPIHIINSRLPKETSVLIGEELESLITTLNGIIVARLMQKIEYPDHHTYIGKGKVEEVAGLIQENQVDVVVLGASLKPKQLHELKKEFQKVNPKIDVWDRIDLILHIFDKHAVTSEAKLQIELARMKYMGPRIYGMGFIMSQQGGGIGTLGIGETNTELMRRHLRDSIKKITTELEKIKSNRNKQLERRKKSGFKTVSIVGYTNAGKSSLFNVLTGKNTFVENELFATLDSNVGSLYLARLGQEVLITDTIGFIRDLPPKLIDAFTSTLMESIHADILLHVVDCSDVEIEAKIRVVNDILQSLGRNPKDMIYVFNKIDAVVDKQEIQKKYDLYSPIFISATKDVGIDLLKNKISEKLTTS